jgi:hypothetical protein
VKPGTNDKQYKILITGQELEELKKFTGDMVEAFGLDRKVENYKGKRAIGFYRWDLDCLEDVLAMAVDDKTEYPSKSGLGYEAIVNVYDRIKELRKQAYTEFNQ